MKKTLIFCAALAVAAAFTSCKSSESAYKKAYEKAKAAEAAQAPEETPVVTPLVEQPAEQPVVAPVDENVAMRSENLDVLDGAGLKTYSVVVGSFTLRANAEGLVAKLKSAGYDAQLARNAEGNTYRVVASTSDDRATAIRSRDALRSNYAGAWLLYKK